jgi:2-(1,2-epoxy-1,2-dihydrophenyl)acetyl-CoA isomerase
MASYEHVTYEVVDGRAEITLDRPDVLNAFNGEMKNEIAEAALRAQNDSDAYVIVLTGAGRGFCSGADISGMGDDDSNELEQADSLRRVQDIVRNLYHKKKPTIAAVNGPAIGAGCDFALACDIRIIEEDAYMRQQFVNIGLIPGDGGGWLLPRLVGEAKAKEYILTGKDITPSAAEEMGLVADVVPDNSLGAARELAEELKMKPAAALQEAKQLIDLGQTYEEYSQNAVEAQWRVKNDPEHSEAVSALRENREPDFDR